MMGYRTPNIDRIAREGAIFTDDYGEQSCTAGRAAFITGPAPVPHRPAHHRHAGRRPRHPRMDADHRRRCSSRWATPPAQFGKNHLGDQDEHLPTNHGFDEFFGNLYHLNAEEEPESYYYPRTRSSAAATARAA